MLKIRTSLPIALLVTLCVRLTPASSAEISIASYSANAGAGILAPVTFAAEGNPVSAVQLDLEYDSSVMSVSFLPGEGGQKAQKRLYTSDLGAMRKRIMLIGPNRNPLFNGVLFNLSISLKATTPVGNFPLKMSQIVCSDPDGRFVSVAGLNGSILVQAAPTEMIAIRDDGVLNAASLRSGPIAPGEIITLFGSLIGPASPVKNQGSVLATTLGGTRVLVNGIAAPLLYVSSGQINAVVPYAVSGNSAKLVVEGQGQKLAELTLPVAEAAPAIFTLDSSGWGQSAILNEDYSVNSSFNPAPRGSVVSLFATGAGQTNPPSTDGQIADGTDLGRSLLPVSVQIGGIAAETLYAGTAPGLISSLLQVNFRVPSATIVSHSVPVSIQIGSVRSQAGVTLAVK